MPYLILIIALAGIALLIGKSVLRKKKQKKIEELKRKWGKLTKSTRNYGLISRYHNCLTSENGQSLSLEVANDIDLEGLFDYIDRTNSKLGQQYLYHQLRSTKKDLPLLEELEGLSQKLQEDEVLRLHTELEISTLEQHNAYYIHELFTSTYAELYSKWVRLYIKFGGVLWVAFCAYSIAAKNQYFFLLTLALTLVNFYIYYTHKNKILNFVHSLPQIPKLMQVAKNCMGVLDDKREIERSLINLTALKRTLRYVNFHTSSSDLSTGLFDIFKAILLTEPAMFVTSVREINAQKESLQNLFDHVAKIDTAISIASLRVGLPYYTKPKFTYDKHELKVEELFHPLIENCVSNSIQTKADQGVLITGSNMSGKTTFIRAVAINALLAQRLFTSCTKSYEAPFMQLFTSITISDNLSENKSYFQTEAISVLNILEESKQKQNNLIIIDEIFRGTNTIERIAAAKAILSYLTQQKNFVFVSTHDLELAELLGEEYACFSFEEKVAESRLVFDYKIKDGILKNKNGIAILASLGYPPSVVDHANEISLSLREKYNL